MGKLQAIEVGTRQIAFTSAGAGMPLLLVHGFPLDQTMWTQQIEALSSRAHVIAPDLPGFGASGSIDGTYSMAGFADDLARFLDVMGITKPIVFCGLSMGGYIAWEFWRRHTQRLRALIICDSRALADDQTVKKGREIAAQNVLAEGVQVVSDSMLPKLFGEAFQANAPEQVEHIKHVMDSTAATTMAAALRGMAARVDFTPMLPEVNKRALLICGEQDVISPPLEMKQIADRMPDARYVTIPKAGHMSPMECPQEVNAAMLAYLERL